MTPRTSLRRCDQQRSYCAARALLLVAAVVLHTAAGAETSSGTYLGCYADTADDRAMPWLLSNEPSISVDICFGLSRRGGFKYFGLQRGHECWAGNDISKIISYGKSLQCDLACAGDSNDTCGGWLANSVYTTEAAAPIQADVEIALGTLTRLSRTVLAAAAPPPPISISTRAGVMNTLVGIVPSVLSSMTAGVPTPTVLFGYDGDIKAFVTSTDFLGDWKGALTKAILAAMPSLKFMDPPADASSWLMRVNISVSPSSTIINLSSPNVLYLLTDLANKLQLSSLGITIPQASMTEGVPTSTAVITTSRNGTLIQVQIGVIGEWTIANLCSRLGVSWPLSPDFLSVRNPRVSVTVPSAARPGSFQLSANISIPAINLVQQAATLTLSQPGTLALELLGSTSLAGGLIVLSNVSLDVAKGNGAQSRCLASFAGVSMDAVVNITSQLNRTNSITVSSLAVGLKAVQANLANVVRNPGMWPSAPPLVQQKLGSLTFPTFAVNSNQGQFDATAGPLAGVTLALSLDSCGLRYIKLDMQDCLKLGELLRGVGLSLSAPDGFTLCNPFVQYVPSMASKNGSCAAISGYTFPNRTVLAPSATAGFVVTITDLGIEQVAARLTYANAEGLALSSFSMLLLGSISLFDGLAVIRSVNISGVSSAGFSASLVISIPDINLVDGTATMVHSSANKSTSFQIQGRASFLDNALVLQGLSLIRTPANISGNATGTLGGYSGQLSFRYSAAANKGSGLDLSLSLSSVNLKPVIQAIGSSASSLFPSFILTADLPALTFAASSGLYSIKAGPTFSGISADIIFDRSGLVKGSLTMQNTIDLGAALSQLNPGIKLPFDVNDIIKIANPRITIVSSRAASLLGSSAGVLPVPGTNISFGLNIPALMSSVSLPCNVPVLDANGNFIPNFAISWQGSFSPVSNVVLNGASLSFQSGRGLVGTATGTIVSMAVQVSIVVADRASRAQGAKALTFTATASGVSAGNVVSTIFPNTDQTIVRLLQNARFATLNFTWDGSFSGISGSPDVSTIPGLSQVLSVLQFSPQDVQMKLTGPGTVAISISKTFTLNLDSPFVGPSYLTFGLGFSFQNIGFQITASAQFSAMLRMSFLDPENVAFSLGAALMYDSGALPPGISFKIAASATSEVGFKGFNFIRIYYIGGSIVLKPISVSPFVSIIGLEFAAKARFLGTDVSADMVWDLSQKDFGVMFTMQNFNLEAMVNALGLQVSLGPLEVVISSASFSFSRTQIRTPKGVVIPAGLMVSASMRLLGVPLNFTTEVTSNGVRIEGQASNLQNLSIIGTVLNAVQGFLNSVGINVRVSDLFSINWVKIKLILTKSETSFSFGASVTVAGFTVVINDFTINPRTAMDIKNSLVNYLKDRVSEIFTSALCRADSQPGSGDSGSGPCAAGFVRRYYRSKDARYWSFCVRACGSNEYDGSGALGDTVGTVATWTDMLTCWRCPNGGSPSWNVATGVTCWSGWWPKGGASPYTRERNCGAGKVEYYMACFNPCWSGYVREGVLTDFSCYQQCRGSYPYKCLNGYACGRFSSCLGFPNKDAVTNTCQL